MPTHVQRDHVEILRNLRTHLDAIRSRLHGHNANGWQQDVLHALNQDTAHLQGTAARIAPEWAAAFGPLLVALRTATAAPHPPTPAIGSDLLAATDRALRLLPPLPESAPAPTAGAETAPRAEYPPAHYWRRWCADSAAADFPDATTVQAAPAKAVDPAPDRGVDESPYRVLVVEDDRSQALFAQGVLSGAGMQAQVVSIPEQVMQVMAEFAPELVLMDLHMPGISGTELTAMIRADPVFAPIPIVFLTGDPDPERQYEVLESGADDFLSKPIRPRHLIAAVHSRIKRVRALQWQRLEHSVRHPLTGLYNRPYLMQRLADALASAASGGALFVELQNTAALHDRYGYAGFEQLMHQAGQRIGELAGACPSARLNDNAFLVFVPDGNEPQLETLARGLRDGISHPPFDMAGMPQRLRAVIGCSTLAHGFADPGNVLDAAEQAARLARAQPIGLASYQPVEDPGRDAELIAAIRTGLGEGGFELMFQPVVAVAGGEEAQYQVLLRMRDGAGELHSAGELVPAAEAAGLMPEIDRWVLTEAIALLHQRRDTQRPVRLFVSQSPRTLAYDQHADWLLETLVAHGIDGPSLVIDLRLEDALVHSVTLRQFCDRLMPAGVQFCLSQYAHGPEADTLLPQLPLGYLRLSPRYSHSNANGPLRDELRLVVDRAHRFGLQVIGQQVEDPQGAAALWMSGIDYIQGNLVQQAAGELDFDFQHSVL